jgi:hypothetical protein
MLYCPIASCLLSIPYQEFLLLPFYFFTDGMKLKSTFGQGYRTPHWAVIYEYGVMVELWSAGEIRGIQRKPATEPRRPLLF